MRHAGVIHTKQRGRSPGPAKALPSDNSHLARLRNLRRVGLVALLALELLQNARSGTIWRFLARLGGRSSEAAGSVEDRSRLACLTCKDRQREARREEGRSEDR